MDCSKVSLQISLVVAHLCQRGDSESLWFFVNCFCPQKLVSIIGYRKANVIWLQFYCWVSANRAHFHLVFQQSGISIHWMWMDLVDSRAFRWASLRGKAGPSWHSTKSVTCEGGKTTFSCEFIMGGEDLQSGKDKEGLCCIPVGEVWRTDALRQTSEVCSPGNPGTAAWHSWVVMKLKSLFSDGYLEGRNKKKFLVWRFPKPDLIIPSV